ncbi:DUF4236 domain-containing protein [Georgenia phoenicis]|uniref:DUF4236 domain-containing protein n=1 Tax=unclassified Georgenia TaxID=2626815 RepID=UPI0039AEDAD9
MGFRARKSIKIALGVRMTISPKSASLRVGPRGAGVSVNTRGRVTKSVGIPGSGVSYQSSSKLGSKPRAARRAPAPLPQVAAAPTPSLFAPKWEKALHRALIKDADITATAEVADKYPEARAVAAIFEALKSAIPAGDVVRARGLVEWVYGTGFDPTTDPFFEKYLPGQVLTLGVAEGVEARLPMDRDSLALLLAELLQASGDLAAAVEVVEGIETPTTIAAVSLAELYAEQERWEEIIALTDSITNQDDPSTYLLIQRAIAFREQGYFESARESFKESLRIRTRPVELRNRAYLERGITYLAEGKRAMARKDLERLLAADSSYPGLQEQIAKLRD